MPFRGALRNRLPPNALWPMILGLGCAVFVLDIFLPLGTGKGVLYAIVVLLSQNLKTPQAPLLVTAYCTILLVTGTVFSPRLPNIPVWVWVSSRAFGLVVIWGSFWFTKVRQESEANLQRTHDELEIRVQARTKELAELNRALVAEIAEHKSTARSLRASESRLADSQRDLERSREDLRALAAQLMTAQEEERRRISHELHDDVNQRLALLAMDIRTMEQETDCMPEHVREGLHSVLTRTTQLSDDIRQMAYRFHPSILDDLGLGDALQQLAEDFSARTGSKTVFVRQDLLDPVPSDIAACLYRVTQEALSNTAKHACASRVEIELTCEDRQLELSIQDMGMGFDSGAKGQTPKGLGLVNMRERVHRANGTVEIRSRPGQGTLVRVIVPIPAGTR